MTIAAVSTRFAITAATLALAAGAGSVAAAGFQINETSASGLGTAFAGAAAVADDATTLWSNVAGIARVRELQVVGAIHLIKPSIKFRNEGSAAAVAQPSLGGEGGDAGSLNVVPNLYVVAPLGPQWSVGLGLNSPFGLVTEYDAGWIGRFQALKSSIKTINVNPGVAWRPMPRVGVGFGLNYQRIDAEFTNQVNYSGALFQAAAQNAIVLDAPTSAAIAGLESHAKIEGSDHAWGWNAGVLWELDDKTRAGAHYRSSIKYRISGDVTFTNPVPVVTGPFAAAVGQLAAGVNQAALFNSAVTSEVKLPAILNLSYFKTLNDRWDVLADAQWTQWSTIQTLSFVRSNGTVLQSTPENFKDTWKVAIGAHHHYNSAWTLRGGIAFDQSPVPSADRTPRLPDADRIWLALGARLRVDTNLTVDAGAAYVLVKQGGIDNRGGSAVNANGRLSGHYDSNTMIASVQVGYSF